MHFISYIFDLKLRMEDIPAFAKAFVLLDGKRHPFSTWFEDDSTMPKEAKRPYPLVQFRIQKGHIAAHGFNEGADALTCMEREGKFAQFRMGESACPLKVLERSRHLECKFVIGPQKHRRRYRINDYMPFTQEDQVAYLALDALIDKVDMLQLLLLHDLQAMGIGLAEPPKAVMRLVVNDIHAKRNVKVLTQETLVFDLEFSTNIIFPDGIALGRKLALGYGSVSIGD